MAAPLAEYETRRGAWAAKLSALQREIDQLGNARVALAVIGAVLAYFAWGSAGISKWWLAIPVVGIVALFARHARLSRKKALAERALRYYDTGIARLKNQWQGKGEAGERFRDANHVYSEDLDVFGKGGLFELLCTARTAAGEDTLAEWLLQPAEREEAAARQDAVRDLATRLDLREDVALLGEDVRAEVHVEGVTRWGSLPAIAIFRGWRILAPVLAVIALVVLLLFIVQRIPIWPVALILSINGLITYFTRGKVARILSLVETRANHLAILGLLIGRMEREPFEAPMLKECLEQLRAGGRAAAAQIKRLGRMVDWLGGESVFLVKLLHIAFLSPLQVALAVEAWRRESGAHLGEWVAAAAEIEALSSLGTLAYERPAWSFPELLATGTAQFEAEELRHPLIADDRSIANSVALGGGAARLAIVSGSNMSGKSTLLRTVGLNAVLALAGAPANARGLRLTPLQTGASIRTTDSLQDNRSRFMAEIVRLRQIVDLTRKAAPVLFLLDELLSGTNSHDRRIGAEGVVKGLLRGNSIGFLTTHDLALAAIADEMGPAAAVNVHFEDRIEDGGMTFDYRLRPGVVTHSNALELMRSVGLDV